MVLTINNSTASSQSVTACDTYTWSVNGQTYTTSGTYTYTGTNASGCTDVKTLVLTINNSTSSDITQVSCNSYKWHGTTYTTSGNYTYTTTNSSGCPNVTTLHLTINYTSTTSETQTACDSYTWNGTTYTTTGDYTYSSLNSSGCTNVATLHLTINNSSTSSESVTSCDSYTWNGTTYTTSGTYTYTSQNASGCPNVATLRLTINSSSTSEESATACDSYTWHGTTYTASGDYTYNSTNTSGCTNVATLHLTINRSTTTSETQTACNSYTWNGNTYTTSGTYTYSSQNAAGCTNVATLHLTINSNAIGTQPTNPTICALAGATGTISVGVPGASSATTYLWYSQVGTGAWTALSNNANYSGVTTTTLSITRSLATVPAVGTKYKLVVSAGCGSVTSNIVTLQDQTVVSKAAVVSVVSTLSPALTTCSGTSVDLSLAAGSVGNIQWQSSTDGTTWNNFGSVVSQSALSVTNAAISFNTGTLTQTTWFRAVASNGVCTSVPSAAVKITVSQPTSVGTLSSSTIVCTGTGAILNLSAASGTIAWQKAPVVGGVVGTFAAVAGNTTSTLSTGNLTATTAYRVVVSSGACSTSTSNVVTVTVSPVSVIKAVSLATTGSICNGGSKTLNLAAGSVGSIQWQSNVSSSTTAPAATDSNWTNITGATDPVSYTASPSTTTWYRAVSTNSVCSSVKSAAVAVTVSQPTSVGTLSSSTTVCTGTGTTLNLDAATGTIAWQKAPVVGGVVGTFAAVAGNTTSTLSTGNLTATTAYRVVVSSGACSTSTSNVVTVTVSPLAVAKTISGNTGATTLATAITSCTTTSKVLTYATTGSVGAIQWQYYNGGSSAVAPTTSAIWTDISGANAATYNAPSLGQTGNVWFRVKVSSSPCSDAFTPSINVWFKACPTIARIEEAPVAAFSAIAYPSPFTENFTLNVTTPSEDKVQVMVYDMIGKLVDQREVSPADAATLEIGDRFPSGVYNVIVTQGDNTKTLRVIKR